MIKLPNVKRGMKLPLTPNVASSTSGPIRQALQRAANAPLEARLDRSRSERRKEGLRRPENTDDVAFAHARELLEQLEGETQQRGQTLLEAWVESVNQLRTLEQAGTKDATRWAEARQKRRDCEAAWDAFALSIQS